MSWERAACTCGINEEAEEYTEEEHLFIDRNSLAPGNLLFAAIKE